MNFLEKDGIMSIESIETINAGLRTAAGLRLVLLTTTDPVARAIARDFLRETEAEAEEELKTTCWKRDMQRPGQLREVCERQFAEGV